MPWFLEVFAAISDMPQVRNGSEKPVFFGLAALWAGLRLLGVSQGLATAPPHQLAPGALSLATSVLLAIVAWFFAVRAPERHARFAVAVALGMSFGLVGDLVLSQAFLEGEASFVGGLLAFALGHAAYLVAMQPLVKGRHGRRARLVHGLIVAGAVVLWYHYIWHAERFIGGYRWVLLAYGVLLASIAGSACGLAGIDRRFRLAAFGSVLFVFSDLWIGISLFNPVLAGKAYAATGLDLVWLSYGTAQFCLVFTVPLLFQRRAAALGELDAAETEDHESVA